MIFTKLYQKKFVQLKILKMKNKLLNEIKFLKTNYNFKLQKMIITFYYILI